MNNPTTKQGWATFGGTGPPIHHSNGTCTSFADGSVRYWKWKDPRTIARYRKKFETEVEPQLLARLEKTPYICGRAFTAADCIIGHRAMIHACGSIFSR